MARTSRAVRMHTFRQATANTDRSSLPHPAAGSNLLPATLSNLRPVLIPGQGYAEFPYAGSLTRRPIP
jgi:hypothetical protein